MSEDYSWLQPKYLPPGLKLAAAVDGHRAGEWGEVKGFYAGEFHGEGTDDQIAIHYRLPHNPRRHQSSVVISWVKDPDLPFVGTAHHSGVPVTVNGKPATYFDGAWAAGPGPDQIKVLSDGAAHWSRDHEHSLTMRVGRGIIGVRCPRSLVPETTELFKIMSSISAS